MSLISRTKVQLGFTWVPETHLMHVCLLSIIHFVGPSVSAMVEMWFSQLLLQTSLYFYIRIMLLIMLFFMQKCEPIPNEYRVQILLWSVEGCERAKILVDSAVL